MTLSFYFIKVTNDWLQYSILEEDLKVTTTRKELILYLTLSVRWGMNLYKQNMFKLPKWGAVDHPFSFQVSDLYIFFKSLQMGLQRLYFLVEYLGIPVRPLLIKSVRKFYSILLCEIRILSILEGEFCSKQWPPVSHPRCPQLWFSSEYRTALVDSFAMMLSS